MIGLDMIGTAVASLLSGGALGTVLTHRLQAKQGAEEITDKQWARFQSEITRLDGRLEKADQRIDILETEVRDCHREKSILEGKVIKLEAAIDSRGEIRQRAAEVVAAERLMDRRAE